jgi:hypothetical protein
LTTGVYTVPFTSKYLIDVSLDPMVAIIKVNSNQTVYGGFGDENIVLSLTAGDTVSVQIPNVSTLNKLSDSGILSSWFCITRMEGIQGPTGPASGISGVTGGLGIIVDDSSPSTPVISAWTGREMFSLSLANDFAFDFTSVNYLPFGPLTDTLDTVALPNANTNLLYNYMSSPSSVNLTTATWTVGKSGVYMISYFTARTNAPSMFIIGGLLFNGVTYCANGSDSSGTNYNTTVLPISSGTTVQLICSPSSGNTTGTLSKIISTVAASASGLADAYNIIWTVTLLAAIPT